MKVDRQHHWQILETDQDGLLLGVEDIVDVKQYEQIGKETSETMIMIG